MDYRKRFKSCGENVTVAPDIFIESPERMEVGDNVKFMSGFTMIGALQECRIGDNVTFFPNSFIQGLRARFVVGNNVEFYPTTYISLGEDDAAFVEIGHTSHFAPGCVLYGGGGLKIGAYCNIAAHVVFATVQHDDDALDGPMARTQLRGPITLEDDVWIAANATITKDTRIAHGCVIGAGAVVTRDTEPMGVYVGVPARRLRTRGERRKR
jgi:acetyltransferase-like isoleucine patch superfamily enzyme